MFVFFVLLKKFQFSKLKKKNQLTQGSELVRTGHFSRDDGLEDDKGEQIGGTKGQSIG